MYCCVRSVCNEIVTSFFDNNFVIQSVKLFSSCSPFAIRKQTLLVQRASMVKSTGDDQNCKTYGVPLYGAGWVPSGALGSIINSSKSGENNSTSLPALTSIANHVFLAGGGGEGSSGIPNTLLISKFDPESNYLSDEPVSKLGTGEDIPYRITVHPRGDGIICALPKSCRLFEWDVDKSTDDNTLSLKSSEKVLKHLEDVGQQLALTFNNEGSLLAVGGEDGKLRVFKWPSMELILDEDNVHASVKDLDFSPDGKFLVSVGGGPAKVWDVEKSTAIASLQKANDERFAFCRFSRMTDENQVLNIIAMHGKGASILKWNTGTWKKISSNLIARDPICAFNVSDDGKYFSVGTIQGDVFILSSRSMRVQTSVKRAHLGVVTALAFSQDSRSLVSVSMASSARVTQIKDERKNGFPLWIIIFMILLAIAAYHVQSKGLLPQKFDFAFRL